MVAKTLSWTVILTVGLVMASFEVSFKMVLFPLTVAVYLLVALFAPLVQHWNAPNWVGDAFDYAFSIKLSATLKVMRAYAKILV
jgi:hypothetical protein